MMKRLSRAAAVVATLALAACGGGSGAGSSGNGSGSGLTGQFTLTVNTTGLQSGESYVIQDSAPSISVSQTLTVSQDGTASFSDPLYTSRNLQGVGVSTTITQQPSDGAQCVVQPTSNGPYAGDGPPVTSNGDLNVSCSKFPAVKPAAYPQIGSFAGVSTAQVIASPKVVPVFFTASTNVSTYQTFLQQLVVSKYWSALSEYSVGNGTVEPAVNATTSWPASVNDAEVQSVITTNSAWSAPLDSSTVLVIFLPAGTNYSATTNSGESLSADTQLSQTPNAEGDHGQVTVNSVPVQYVIVPADNESGGAPEQFGNIAAHLVGAVTNPGGGGPNIAGSEGYVEASPSPDWYLDLSGEESVELGHACSADAPSESDITLPSGFPGLNQIWSNKAAANDTTYTYCGRHPYGVMADWSSSSDAQTVTATRFAHTFADQALVIPPGGSATITLTAWSLSSTIASNNSEPYFDFDANVNSEWLYLHGTAAPEECLPDDTTGDCASMPSFTITPVVSANDQSSSSCSQGCDFSQTVNGDTFKVTITMQSSSTPGLWVMYLGDQPIAVTNSVTWN